MTASPHVSLAHLWPVVLLVLIAAAGIFVFGRGLARSIARTVYRCSVVLGAVDAKVIDQAGVNGAARLTHASSAIAISADDWIIDGAVKAIARIIWTFSLPVRMIQSGAMQSYMLLMVIGLIGFLGYYLYMAHHAIR
jgi:hypothetical protein